MSGYSSAPSDYAKSKRIFQSQDRTRFSHSFWEYEDEIKTFETKRDLIPPLGLQQVFQIIMQSLFSKHCFVFVDLTVIVVH